MLEYLIMDITNGENSEGWLSYVQEQTRRQNSSQIEALNSIPTNELRQIVADIRNGNIDPVVKQALGLIEIDESFTAFTLCAADEILEKAGS